MRLLRGAPGSGKTRQVFREFKDALRSGESNLRLVVPTATLVRHFQHELARDGIVFSPRFVVSLHRLLLECAGDAMLIPDGLLRVLVRDALQRLPFPEFAGVAGTDGMADTVVETIGLFENAGCTPEKLALVRQREPRRLGPHAGPFGKLWRSVRDAAHERGFLLYGEWVRAAASNVPSARIWFDGFLNFSPVEEEFVSALARACDVTLAITNHAAGEDIYRLGLKLGAQDCLLAGASRKPQIAVTAAAAPEREADEIARRILAWRGDGIPFREMGVALRDPSVYVPLLRCAFARFGIPARFYFSSPLRTHPAAVFLEGLISGALTGWDFETTLRTFRAHPRFGVRADFDRFDFAVRKTMPGRGAAELLSLCESERLREDIGACLKVESWRSMMQTPSQWLQRFESLATNLYRPGFADIAPDHLAIDAARSHAAALRNWIDAVESVISFWPNPAQLISLAEFQEIASVAIDAAAIQPLNERANVVHVMSAWEARQWDVACLLVCGTTDRDFPQRQAQNLLFPESDLERLRSAGIPLRNSADYERQEEWLFASLRTRAAQSLVLTYPEHDSSGKSLQRSRYLDQPSDPAPLCRASLPVPPPPRALPGRIGAPALHAELAHLHQSIGMTSLENLTQCRFQFFSQKTLRLDAAPERPEERINPRTAGLILHKALEQWLTDTQQDFVAVFESAFNRMCHGERLPAGYRLEVDRFISRNVAKRISASDLWTPDSSQAEVPLTIEFPGGIQVNGRVDRIDRFGGDCVIVDYKSSKTANVEKLVTSATRLQGPLYALAVREKLGLNPVAMIFWAVREDKRFGWGAVPGVDTGDDLRPMPENWTTDARTRTIERLTGFLAGQVHADPVDPDLCVWCDYASACRVEQPALVQIGAGQHV